MRGDELLDVLERIDPDLIEKAARKPKVPWLRWTAMAACLALIVGLCVHFFSTARQQTPVNTPMPMISLIDHTICPESLTGAQIIGSPVSGSDKSFGGTQGCPPIFSFDLNLMVEAKVIEVLPDAYTDPTTRWQFHIIRFETLEVMAGKNFPKEFYLRLSLEMSTELDQFDSLILSLRQVGIEDYILLNQTTRTMEAFSLVFEMDSCRHWSHFSTAMAFDDGVLDPSLWELEKWEPSSYYVEKILAGDPYINFPAKEGSTVEDVKNYIYAKKQQSQQLQNLTVQTQADFSKNAAFDYVKPFVNGVFIQSQLVDGGVTYMRIINGFHTTERIALKGGSATYEGEAFTKEDLSALPDLGGMIETLDLESLEQPYGQYYNGLDVRLWNMGATGMYAKVDGQVYGIVKVTWHYLKNGVYDTTISYYDALYYLINADGSYCTASWEELQYLIGNNDFLVQPTTLEELCRDWGYDLIYGSAPLD